MQSKEELMSRFTFSLTLVAATVLTLFLATVDGLAQSTPNTHLTPDRLAEVRLMMSQPR